MRPSLGPFFDPFKGQGTLMRLAPDKAVWVLFDEDGDTVASCTQYFADPIIEENKRALNNSAGQRWGDGKIVASIPLDIFFDKIIPADNAGDEKYIKRFLNDIDNAKFRRFGGKV